MTPQKIAIAALEEASHEDDPVDIAVTYRIALEQIAKGGWIPVSERLPEYGERVLTTDGSCVRISFYAYSTWGRPTTAWMPLPEAYKEAADETD